MTRAATWAARRDLAGGTSSQSGATMLETMLIIAITAMVLVPLFGWTMFVLHEQGRTSNRAEDVASVGIVRTTFSRDVASAATASQTGTDCTGGGGSGGTVKLVMNSATNPARRVVYTVAPMVDNGVASATVSSLWRRACGTSGSTTSTQVIKGINGAVTVTCTGRTGVPSPDTCGQIRLTTKTMQNNAIVSLSGARRTTGTSVAVALGGGKQAPIAAITTSQSNPDGYRNLVVNFSSAGSSDPDGTISSYYWEFGNGATSTDANPAYTYTTVGTFTVSLTVTDNDGAPKTAYTSIQVNNRAPVAVIANSAASLTGPRPLTVAFSSAGSNDSADPGGSITSYAWSFGDGASSTSTLANPSHTYTSSGTFSATLTVTDNNGGSTSTSKVVTVTNAAPIVQSIGFTCVAGTTPCTSGTSGSAIGTTTSTLTTAFTSSATDPDGGTIASYEWTVSPTATIAAAASQNTSITFPSAGTYAVSLRVKDNDGAWSTQMTKTVKVNAPPIASLTKSVSNANGYRPLTATLSASASSDADGTVASYAWSSSDGKAVTGSGANVTFTWNATDLITGTATRTVTLTVTDDNGGTKTTTTTVTLVNRAPAASFTTSPATGPKPLAVTFDGTSSSDPDGTAVTYQWKVDGTNVGTAATYSRTFTTTATSTVSLTVTDIDGATNTTSTTVTPTNSAPTASFTFACQAGTTPCTAGTAGSMIGTLSAPTGGSLATLFSGTGTDPDGGTISAYEWTVSPSATISNAAAASPTITFSNRGTYTVSFRVKDNDNTWSTTVSTTVVVNAPPSVTLTVPAGGRAPYNGTFTRTASDPEGTALTYLWTFGSAGTSTSTGASVAQAFNTPGTYPITLKVTDANGGSTTTSAQNLVVTGAPYPTLSGTGSGCVSLCFGNRYIDFSFTNKPTQVDQFELDFTSNSNGLCSTPGNATTASSANTLRVSTGCILSSTYKIKVRAHDSVTGVWGDWSGEITVTT